MTRIKKIDGDRSMLRDELKVLLKSSDCVVNSTTGHIMIKGHHKPQVEKFLRQRMF
jgi:large subunit ribosomal protein L49